MAIPRIGQPFAVTVDLQIGAAMPGVECAPDRLKKLNRDLAALAAAVGVLSSWSGPVQAQDQPSLLARQLVNPVAALISAPFQLNCDQDIGPTYDGDRWLMNVQPVVPVSINDDWNLISHTILPVISQSDVFPGSGSRRVSATSCRACSSRPSKPPTAAGSGARARCCYADRQRRFVDDRQVGCRPDGPMR
jgi:hypothetical protein